MGGGLSPRPEIARCGDDPTTEVMLPKPVRHDAGKERTCSGIDVGEPFGKGFPGLRFLRIELLRDFRFGRPGSDIRFSCREEGEISDEVLRPLGFLNHRYFQVPAAR